MAIFIKKIIFPILLFISIFLIFLHLVSDSKTTINNYTLKAYKNTVALYNGEEIIDVYDNIVLNTLPNNDVSKFKSGISVASPSQAEIYLQDFE